MNRMGRSEGSTRFSRALPTATILLRLVVGVLVAVFLVWYTASVLSGHLNEERQIGAVHLGIMIVGIAAILLAAFPEVVGRIGSIKVGSIELAVRELKETQERQARALEIFSLVLPFLLPIHEQRHLVFLYVESASEYEGHNAMRNELRRLRSFGLLAMRPGRYVGHMHDGKVFDLADYIELTDLGRRWAETIIEVGGPDLIEDNMQHPKGKD